MKQQHNAIFKWLVALPVLLLGYLSWWAVAYRMPGAPDATVDLRQSSMQIPYYVTFCASLAGNPHGFPGHAYVVWSPVQKSDLPALEEFGLAESAGYVPRRPIDQIASVCTEVPGSIVFACSKDNLRNLSRLTAIVDASAYERSRKLKELWDVKSFRAGAHDCVSFVDFLAADLGLKIPSRWFLFPQDHLAQLKILNKNIGLKNVQGQATAVSQVAQ